MKRKKEQGLGTSDKGLAEYKASQRAAHEMSAANVVSGQTTVAQGLSINPDSSEPRQKYSTKKSFRPITTIF